MTVTLWPTIASQRSRISVLSRSRWVCWKSGVVNDLIMPGLSRREGVAPSAI